MAIYRTVNLSFWSDTKITDDFTPEDKYFYLYLLTNTYTNICGCYEISIKQMARDTGYNEETIKRLLNRMDSVHDVTKYDEKTKELIVWNWHKYNWTMSKDMLKGVFSVAENIKNNVFKNYIVELITNYQNGDKNKTVYRGSIDPMETSVTVTVNNKLNINSNLNINNNINNINNNLDTNNNLNIIKKNIINYLNNKIDSHYKYTSKATSRLINARMNDGFTEEDFYTVIDKKTEEWKNDLKMSKYLTPDTLFGTKFEKYLNQKNTVPENGERDILNEWRNA